MAIKYNDVMARVKLTPDMYRRVADNACAAAINAAPRIVRANRKNLITVAACAAVMLICAAVIPKLLPSNNDVLQNNGIEECASVEELSDKVGFEVDEIEYLPFETAEENYISLWGGNDSLYVAEINYSGEDKTATFRMSVGNDDNSGDYNTYAEQMSISVGGEEVMLKGDGGEYTLALWSDDTYSYSVSLSDGCDVSTWQKIIDGIS